MTSACCDGNTLGIVTLVLPEPLLQVTSLQDDNFVVTSAVATTRPSCVQCTSGGERRKLQKEEQWWHCYLRLVVSMTMTGLTMQNQCCLHLVIHRRQVGQLPVVHPKAICWVRAQQSHKELTGLVRCCAVASNLVKHGMLVLFSGHPVLHSYALPY